MSRHRDELRAELLEAAHRRTQEGAPVRRRHRRPWRVGVAAAAATACVALVLGLAVDDVRPAAAAFDVHVVDDALVIQVIDSVRDPVAAAAELDRHGISVELVGVPASPSLVGDVVATTAESNAAEVEEERGRVTAIRIARDSPTQLTIRYGRPAATDESYEATESIPGCSRYSGQLVTDQLVEALGRRWGPELRWQQVGGTGLQQLDPSAIAPGARFVDILPLGPDEVMIIVTDASSPTPEGMTC